jgi:hypothetical protein
VGREDSLLQEFAELPWSRHSREARLERGPELDALRAWLADPNGSELLLTLVGDGEYRLQDAFLAHQVFAAGSFGAVYGSRTQSRRQFHSSLRAAYGEGTLLYLASWLGAYIFTGVLGARFQVVLSDPLTGFRLYRRSRLPQAVREALPRLRTSSQLTRLLLQHGVEIAEVPVAYRTYRGFTKAGWRFRRGLRDLLAVLAP